MAIISHPDAGKTTLTEKFLLYAGAVGEAGTVKARGDRRKVVSDWMDLEKQRGISISSTVLQFEYRNCIINLLDTPGHRDFSEDTYRVLAAADAAIMVLDVARGIEPQTLKLFEVCRARHLPVITFLNKLDRPGLDPLELLDEIEQKINLIPIPITWPVGQPGDFKGVIDRTTGNFVAFERQNHGARIASEEHLSPDEAANRYPDDWRRAVEEDALLEGTGANFNRESFLNGKESPLFVGSALTNFGVRHLLDAIVDLVPTPSIQIDIDNGPRALDSDFSGFVFKLQANMNPAHRDHVAFVRVCSGHFERGMVLLHSQTGKPFSTKYATSMFGADRIIVDNAWPGDIIGLVNASGLRIGDTLFETTPVIYPPMPAFAPELIGTARPRDVSRAKQFKKGLQQLHKEGVIQVLRRLSDDSTHLAAVGIMQFEVLTYRMEMEFGAPIELTGPTTKAIRKTDHETAAHLSKHRTIEIFEREDGVLLAAFFTQFALDRARTDHPDWTLDTIVNT